MPANIQHQHLCGSLYHCYAHLKLHHQTLDSLVTKFSTLTDSDIYWAK